MSNNLYVGNLAFSVTEETVRSKFDQFGNVASCKLITDRDTGRSKGFAFIEMGSSKEAQEAIANLDGSDLEGRNMRVSEARPQEPRPQSGSHRGGRW